MSNQRKSVRVSAAVLAALQERADELHKSLDDMANEAILAGLASQQQRKDNLAALMLYGHHRAEETHPGLDEQGVVDIVHAHRERRGR